MLKTNSNLAASLRTSLLAGAALLAMGQSAFALEGAAFTGRIESLFRSFGLALDLGEAVVKGDKVVVSGFTVRPLAEPETPPNPADTELTFTGVEERPDGSYKVAQLVIPDIAYEDAESGFSLANIRFSHLLIPATDTPTIAELIQVLGAFSAGPLTASAKGEEVLTIDTLSSNNAYLPEQGTQNLADVKSDFTAAGIRVDFSSVDDAENKAMLDALGIEGIAAEFTETMSWSLEKGDLELGEMSLELVDLGSLNMTFGLSGYTMGLVESITKASAELAELDSEADAEKRAAAEQALGMTVLAQLSITGLEISYEDDSLAEKLIGMMAREQQIEPAAMREGLKIAARDWLTGTGSPELVAAAAEPIETFLDDPQSLTVSVSPSRSLSFIELVALAQTPAVLMQTLQLSVTANDE